MSDLHERLSKLQAELKAPKNLFNKFGNYKYRNLEGILEAVKPLLNGLTLVIRDDIKIIGDRIYVQAIATISDGKEKVECSAFAREEDNKKGMDSAQLTGSTSSYARKYALNGLFLIDDSQDADATNDHGKKTVLDDKPKEEPKKTESNVDKSSENKPSPTSFKRRKLIDNEGI